MHAQSCIRKMTHVSNTSPLSVKLAHGLGVMYPHGTLITAPIMRHHQLQLAFSADVQLSEFSDPCSNSASTVGARTDDALCFLCVYCAAALRFPSTT